MQKQGEDSPQVVLVSHEAFLPFFTEDWEDCQVMRVLEVSATIYLVTQRIAQHGIWSGPDPDAGPASLQLGTNI